MLENQENLSTEQNFVFCKKPVYPRYPRWKTVKTALAVPLEGVADHYPRWSYPFIHAGKRTKNTGNIPK